MSTAFEAAQPLCAVHFPLVLEASDDAESRQQLLASQAEKLKELKRDIETFVAKHDHRRLEEAMGRERDSWLRAVRTLVGLKDVF